MQDRSPSPPRDSKPREMQALLDATVDAVILIDHQGRIESFNRSGERLFGYRADEVIGRNVNVLMTERDRDSHDAYMHRYLSTGVPHIIGVGREVDARRKDGSVFPVFLSVGRIHESDPPRFVGLLHDITLRRESMAAIRRERDRANMYLEMAQVILVALSADCRIQLINRKGCDTLGWREVDLLGRDWLEAAVPPQQREMVRAQFARLERRGGDAEVYCEHDVMVAGGGRRLIAWRCIALRNLDGQVVGYFSSGEDITVRRAIEQSVERTRSLLNEAQEIGNIGNFEVHVPDTGIEFWSPQLHRIFGLDPSRSADRLAIRRRLGYLPQDPGFQRGFTAFEFVDYVAILKEFTEPQLRHQEVRRVLAAVDLGSVSGKRVRSLSGGMRRRVALAASLLGEPDLLVLDEPTAGLDPEQRLRFRELVSRAGEGRAVLLSTHQTEDVAALCRDVVVLHEGRVRFRGSPGELTAQAGGRAWYSATRDPRAQLAWRLGDGRYRNLGDPPAGAEPAEPTLEDGYLLLVGRQETEEAA